MKHERAKVNGVELHYLVEGKGEPVILLHGWPQTSYEWRKIIPRLAEKYTVVAPDLRGLGDSSRPEGGYDKRTLAADVHARSCRECAWRGPPRVRTLGHRGKARRGSGDASVVLRRRGARQMTNVEIYSRFMGFLGKGEIARIPEVVDVDAYTENCVGLTPGWVHGFDAALQNYVRVVAPAFSEISVERLETLEQGPLATFRQRISARHTGELLGVPATGRRVAYEALDMVRIENGRIVWRWLLIDLWGLMKMLRGEG